MADAPDPAPAADAPARRAPDDPHPTDLDTAALRHHGDAEVAPGLLDFAVNVQGDAPPRWLRDRLVATLDDLARYPTAAADARARGAVAARHGRRPDEVLVLAGSAEGFAGSPSPKPPCAPGASPSSASSPPRPTATA